MRIGTFSSIWARVWIGVVLLASFGLSAEEAGHAQERLPTVLPLLQPSGQVGGIAPAAHTQGNYAYMGVGPRVEVVDLTKQTHPVVARSSILPGIVRSMTAAGNLLYVALGDQGVQIIDVSTPFSPTLVSNFKTSGRVTDVAISGNYAFVTSVFDSFRVFDVSDPAAVSQAGEYAAVSVGEGVEIAGGYAYLAAGSDGLVTVDVSDPANPQAGGKLATTGYARDVVVNGSTAFVADGYGSPGLVAVNVSDPKNPVQSGGYSTSGEAYALALQGNILFVTTWSSGLTLLDVSSPASPSLLGGVDTPGRAVDVAVAGDSAFVADDWGGWRRVNVMDPANPSIAGETITPGEVHQVAVDGSRAVILDNSLGAFVVDVTDPTKMQLLGRTTAINGATENAKDVALAGNYAYVIQDGNLRVVDLADPGAPAVGATISTPGQAEALSVYQQKLFVADGAAGLHIYSLADPANPAHLGAYATAPDEATRLLVNGNFVYLAANGLHVVDVSNPVAPVQAGFYKPEGLIFGMSLAGHRLYLSGAHNGIWILNVSNPATPAELHHYEARVGNEVAAAQQGVYANDRFFNLSPTLTWFDAGALPAFTSLADYPANALDMQIVNGTLYAAANWSGLLAFPAPGDVQVHEVRPNQGRSAWANLVNVYGSNFRPGVSARLVTSTTQRLLELSYLSSSHLQVVVPAGSAPDVYAVQVSNPDFGSSTLDNAYTVTAPEADFLYGYADELWVGPHAARQNRGTGVGLVVHRAGGSAERTDVSVDFYQGAPQAGGTHLGKEAIPSLSPNSFASTIQTAWTPAGEGAVDLYAVINPGGIVVSRTVQVLPPAVDVTPPVVDGLTAGGGPDFASPNLVLTVRASDNSGGSGVSSIYLMEFDWNPNLGSWVKVADTGWIDYTGDPMQMAWTLHWSPGVKNLVAWAGDRAGNVSTFNKVLWLNFMPPAMSVNQGMWHFFSYWLDPGNALSATSTPVSGDPDLYLCCSGSGWIDSSINEGTVADSVNMTASARDLYSVGVYGWTTARYGLSVSGLSVSGLSQRAVRSPAREPVGLPAAPRAEAPPQALPNAPVGYRIYLPTALK